MRINNQLAFFSGILIFLGGFFAIVLGKCLPLLFTKALYFCSSNSLSSIGNTTPIIGFAVLSFTLLVIFTIFIRIIYTVWENNRLRNTLLTKSVAMKRIKNVIKKYSLQDKVTIVKSNKQFAFCLGFLTPTIFISLKTVTTSSQKELEAILIHEREHLRNRDSFILFIASLSQTAFPFIPLLSDLITNYKIQREIAADKKAIEIMGTKKPLVSILSKMLSTESVRYVTISALAEGFTIEPRICALTTDTYSYKKFGTANMLFSLLSFSILFFLAVSPMQAVEVKTASTIDRITTLSVCLPSSACHAICQQSGSVLNSIKEEKTFSSQKNLFSAN